MKRFSPPSAPIALAALFVTCLAILANAAAVGEASEGPATGLEGKYLRIVMSADDRLCGRLFRFYDEHYLRKGQHAWDRYDDDPMFQIWTRAKNVTDDDRLEPTHWAEIDIDNDGVVELIVRGTATMGPYYRPRDFIRIFKGRTKDWFLSQPWKEKELVQASNRIINFAGVLNNGEPNPKGSPKGSRNPYDLRKHPDYQPGRASYQNPYFYHMGYINPFHYGDLTYYAAFLSVSRYGRSIWGIVLKPRPDGDVDDICYFDTLRKYP